MPMHFQGSKIRTAYFSILIQKVDLHLLLYNSYPLESNIPMFCIRDQRNRINPGMPHRISLYPYM